MQIDSPTDLESFVEQEFATGRYATRPRRGGGSGALLAPGGTPTSGFRNQTGTQRRGRWPDAAACRGIR